MTNKEVVLKVLEARGCLNNKEIAMAARRLGYDLTPAQAAGTLRVLYTVGSVSKSNCGSGSMVYWINKEVIK